MDSKGGSISRGRVMSKIEGVKGWAGISCNCEEMLVYTLSRSLILSDLCPSLKRIFSSLTKGWRQSWEYTCGLRGQNID